MGKKIMLLIYDPELVEKLIPMMPAKFDQDMSTIGFNEYLVGFPTLHDSKSDKKFLEYK